MATVRSLVKRNLRLFFRDKASVFFSLLSVIIIIGLYALFLGDLQVQSLNSAVGKVLPDAGWLVNAWILAGVIAVTTVTVSLAAYGTMIDDMHNGQIKDFFVAPIKRGQLVFGYMISAALISLIMNIVSFAIAEGYIVLTGGELLGPLQIAEVLGVLVLSIFSFSSMMCFIASFLKSPQAFGTLSTIIGTLIGFFTGIYVPVGVLPESIGTAMMFLPFSYSAAWLRQIFTKVPMEKIFTGAPVMAAKSYADAYGIYLYFGEKSVETWMMALIIAATGVVFFVFSVWRLSKRTWVIK
ncbi:MAG: ABC transporter permease [Eubacteriales bacterium]|nr:ABC transporter permease [Eubacteriales bacterium]